MIHVGRRCFELIFTRVRPIVATEPSHHHPRGIASLRPSSSHPVAEIVRWGKEGKSNVVRWGRTVLDDAATCQIA